MLIKKCNGTAEVTFPIAVGTQEAFFVNITKGGITYTPTTPILTTDITAINNYLTVNGLIECVFVSTLINCIFQVTQSVVAYDNVNIVVTDTASPLEPASITGVFSLYGCLWIETAVRGCTDSTATNYNPLATEDNDTCNYEPISDLNKIICCLGKQEYELAIMDKYGLIPVKNRHCKFSQLLFKQKGLEYLQKFIDIGTEIIPGDPIHPATTASVTINLNILSDTGAYLNTVLEIGGVNIIATFVNNFYDTLDDYGAAIEAAIDLDPSGYEATYYPSTDLVQPNTLVITAPAPGSAYNLPINFSFTQDRFFEANEISTVQLSNFPLGLGNTKYMVPYVGAYVETTGDILFSGWNTWAFGVFDENGQINGVDNSGGFNFAVTYNPVIDVIYADLAVAAKIFAYDTSYIALGGGLDLVGASRNVYCDVVLGKIFVCENNGIIEVFDANSDPTSFATPIGLTISIGGINAAYRVVKHPTTGMLWLIVEATSTIYEIDPDAQTLTGMSIDLALLTPPIIYPNVVDLPADLTFIDNQGTLECWIVGASIGNAVCMVLDADSMSDTLNTVVITCIDVRDQITQAHRVVQNSVNKYVYISNIVGGNLFTLIIDPITRNKSGEVAVLERNANSTSIIEHGITHKMFISQPQPSPPNYTLPHYVQVLDYEQTLFAINSRLTGGDEANEFDVPAVVTEESDNCFTAQEQEDNLAYMVTNNCCEDC